MPNDENKRDQEIENLIQFIVSQHPEIKNLDSLLHQIKNAYQGQITPKIVEERLKKILEEIS